MKQNSKQIHLYINNDTCYIIDIEKKAVTIVISLFTITLPLS